MINNHSPEALSTFINSPSTEHLPNPPPSNSNPDSADANPTTSQDGIEAKPTFEVLEQIGAGGFAQVFKVRSSLFGDCAVKRIKRFNRGRDTIKSIMNEVDVLEELDHPNIIKLLTFEIADDICCLVTEYASGGDLSRLLKDAPISETRAKSIIMDIGKALDHIHDLNILHRDIKLENILLTSDGQIKLADFGLAAMTDDGSTVLEVCGTPHIKAPELIKKYIHTKSGDWWGLGVILYQLVTGMNPFEPTSGDNKTLYHNIVHSDPIIPSSVSPQCSEVIRNLLQKSPDSRISCFEDLMCFEFFHVP